MPPTTAGSRGDGETRVGFDEFFYPLDAIRDWNLLYGSRGFVQYQCVIPEDGLRCAAGDAGKISRDGMGSFLAVLKRFGRSNRRDDVVPRPGLTLALDFPMRGERTLRLAGRTGRDRRAKRRRGLPGEGRAHEPAKRSRPPSPRSSEFQKYMDPALSSSFWRRVTGG